jgi:hypothetical protein
VEAGSILRATPNRLRSHQPRTFKGPPALGSVAFSPGPLGLSCPILLRFALHCRRIRVLHRACRASGSELNPFAIIDPSRHHWCRAGLLSRQKRNLVRHLQRTLPVVRAEAAHAIRPGRLRSLLDDRWFDSRWCAILRLAIGSASPADGQSGRHPSRQR